MADKLILFAPIKNIKHLSNIRYYMRMDFLIVSI
jgi:hypothetical protein